MSSANTRRNKRRAPSPPKVTTSSVRRNSSQNNVIMASNLRGKRGENRMDLTRRRCSQGNVLRHIHKSEIARLNNIYAENQRARRNAVRGEARALGYSRRLAMVMWTQTHSKPGTYNAFSPFPLYHAPGAKPTEDKSDIDSTLPTVIQHYEGFDGTVTDNSSA